MNHITRLTHERDEAQAVIRQVREELIALQHYLQSDKFAWPENDFVHVRTDILPKLTAIQFLTCGQ